MTRTKQLSLYARLFLCALLLKFTASGFAALSVQPEPTGAGPLPFGGPAAPTVAEGWSTLTIGANATTITTTPAMDAAVQTRDAATVTTALGSSATAPTPSANAIARWNSVNLNVQSVPTGNDYTLLMATLQNDTGGDVGTVTVSYNYGVITAPAEDAVRGFRAFYSVSGAPNSWTLIPEFSSDATTTLPAGAKTATFPVSWLAGTPMYILWADDNGTGTEGIFTIDDFAVHTTGLTVTPINITTQPQSAVVAERGSVSFTVAATGTPQTYHWSSNSTAIPGANSATYSIPSAPFSANGAVFTCVVSNALGGVTSAGATLTVTGDTAPPHLLSAHASTNGTDIILTFSEPMNTGYTDPGNFLIFETDLGVGAAFSPNAAAFNGNVVTLTLATPLTDAVNYSMQIYDVYDTSLAVDPPNVIEPYGDGTNYLVRRDLLLIDFDGPNNVWSWTAETNLFNTGWETVGYDDSLWPSGPGALGVNTDANVNAVPIRTATAYPTPGNSAPQFFRRHFFLPASAVGTTLAMRHMFEDGAVVYINGQEAGRYNVAAGALSVTSRAAANAADPTPVSASLPLPATNLVAGDNVIAVVVLQSGATSTDSIMALELVANVGTYAAGPPSIVTPPASQAVAEGANVTFSVVADGALPLTYHWLRNGVPISGAHAASYSLLGVLPSQTGNYSVIVSNTVSTATSASAALTVTADTTAPAFVSAVGDANLTNITLTIADAFGLNTAAAQNPAHYSIVPTGGGAPVSVLTAVLNGNGSNVVLTTTPRTQLQNYNATLSGVVDRSEAANAATPSTRPVIATVVLMAYNHVWRYDETGNDLGSAWSSIGYDDSAWLSGAGFLAFEPSVAPATLFTNLAGGNGANTILNLTNQTLGGIGGTNITFYFRTTVSSLPFDPNAPGNSIRATPYFDDGGVIYVNGSEQLRFNYTNSPVALNYTNVAIAASTEGAGGLITSNLTGFVQAHNVIAAEVHQNSMTSSDIAWGMQLEALVTSFAPGCGPLHIVDNGNGTVTITWSGAGTLQSSTDLGNPLLWTNVGGSPASGYTPSSAGAPKFYRLTCP